MAGTYGQAGFTYGQIGGTYGNFATTVIVPDATPMRVRMFVNLGRAAIAKQMARVRLSNERSRGVK